MAQSTQRALKDHLKITQRARKQSDFIILSVPKILRLVNFRAGEDAETVVCALFHDVGELLSPVCHGEIGESGI